MALAVLDQQTIDARLAGLDPDWVGTTTDLRRTVDFADFPTAVAFVSSIVPYCEEKNHHPYVTVRWRRVDLVLSTHSLGGVTDADVELAVALDDLAAKLPQQPRP